MLTTTEALVAAFTRNPNRHPATRLAGASAGPRISPPPRMSRAAASAAPTQQATRASRAVRAAPPRRRICRLYSLQVARRRRTAGGRRLGCRCLGLRDSRLPPDPRLFPRLLRPPLDALLPPLALAGGVARCRSEEAEALFVGWVADDEGGELVLCTRAAPRAAGLAVEGYLGPAHLEPRLRQLAPPAQHPAVDKLTNKAVDRLRTVLASYHRGSLLLGLRNLATVLEQRAAPLHAHLRARHAVAVAGVVAAVHVDPQVRGGHAQRWLSSNAG
eukprot:scaffold80980_cov54-Phaeocystis_antarctica.AAC.2